MNVKEFSQLQSSAKRSRLLMVIYLLCPHPAPCQPPIHLPYIPIVFPWNSFGKAFCLPRVGTQAGIQNAQLCLGHTTDADWCDQIFTGIAQLLLQRGTSRCFFARILSCVPPTSHPHPSTPPPTHLRDPTGRPPPHRSTLISHLSHWDQASFNPEILRLWLSPNPNPSEPDWDFGPESWSCHHPGWRGGIL